MKYIYFRILAGLVLIVAIAGIAFIAYNAGVNHSVAANNPAPAVQNHDQIHPVYGPYWRPFGFFGFGCFVPLVVLFLFFLAFGAMRSVIWGPRWGWRRMHPWHYPWSDKGPGEGIPPIFAEMHRRMHAADEGKTADTTPQK